MKFSNYFFRKFFTISFVLLFLFNYQPALAGTSPKDLVSRVQSAISAHYLQDFNVIADKNGKVEIKGTVDVLYDRYRIFDIVSRVRGVREISDMLIVDAPMRPDEMILSNAEEQIKIMHSILEPNRITLSVDQGVVLMKGVVSFHRERLLLETAVSQIKGVKGIVNEIRVLKPKQAVSDENLRIVFNEILKNQFGLEKNVQFKVMDGKVTLSGTVHLLWSKIEIGKEFSRIHGVKQVTNNLKVVEEL